MCYGCVDLLFFCLVVFDLGDALLYCEVVCRCRV